MSDVQENEQMSDFAATFWTGLEKMWLASTSWSLVRKSRNQRGSENRRRNENWGVSPLAMVRLMKDH